MPQKSGTKPNWHIIPFCTIWYNYNGHPTMYSMCQKEQYTIVSRPVELLPSSDSSDVADGDAPLPLAPATCCCTTHCPSHTRCLQSPSSSGSFSLHIPWRYHRTCDTCGLCRTTDPVCSKASCRNFPPYKAWLSLFTPTNNTTLC